MAPLTTVADGLAKMSSDDHFVDAVRKFQNFAGLNQTGKTCTLFDRFVLHDRDRP
jgi:hypothetical protein